MLTQMVHLKGSQERRREIRILRGVRLRKFMLRRGIQHFRDMARELFPDSDGECIEHFGRSLGTYAAGTRTMPLAIAVLLGKTYKRNAHFFYINYIDEHEEAAIKRLWQYSLPKLRAMIVQEMQTRKNGAAVENEQDIPSPPPSVSAIAHQTHTASGNGNGKVEPSVPFPTVSVGTNGSTSPTTFTCGPSSYEWSGRNGIHNILITEVPEQEARLLFILLRLTAGQPTLLDGLCRVLQKTSDPAQSQ